MPLSLNRARDIPERHCPSYVSPGRRHRTFPSPGLYLATFRAYDPVPGRWLSRDPIGETGDSEGNLYAYVGGNPISLRDPRGLDNPGMGPYGPGWGQSCEGQSGNSNDRGDLAGNVVGSLMGLGSGIGTVSGAAYGLGVGMSEAAEAGSIVFAAGIGDAVASGAMAGAMLGGAVGAVIGVAAGTYIFYYYH